MSENVVQRVVTIDGPSGGGKSTVSKKLAEKLGFTYLDTGAMYRGVALLCQQHGVDPQDSAALTPLLADLSMTLLPPADAQSDVRVILNGEEVGHLLRTQEMGMLASAVSALPEVRQHLTHMQQQMGALGNIVAEGRDTGTVVFPMAAWKFYLDAQPEVRMKRRAEQLKQQGKAVDEQALLQQIVQRDEDDSSRDVAPLKMAEDALFIDSSNLTIEEVTAHMFEQVIANPA